MSNIQYFIEKVYSTRMVTPFQEIDKHYLIYEFSRPNVVTSIWRYFQLKNWDLDSTFTKICHTKFPFPLLQLEADQDPAQPVYVFDGVEKECPYLEFEWIKNASHFDNFDRPNEVADSINRFLLRHHKF
jgi:pimeloyl-ACP methyl ester carboxylesterase